MDGEIVATRRSLDAVVLSLFSVVLARSSLSRHGRFDQSAIALVRAARPARCIQGASELALLPSRGSHPGWCISPPTQIRQCAAGAHGVQLAQLGTGELLVDLRRAFAGSAAVCSARGGTRCVARAGEGCARAAA